MKSRPELPPKYYLTHFKEFLSELEESTHLLREAEIHFLSSFSALSEDAQCLYVRMVNRKGRIFNRGEFVYKEIEQIEDGFRELEDHGFIRQPQKLDAPEIISTLKKHQILELLLSRGIEVKKSSSKPALVEKALEFSALLLAEKIEGIFIQEKVQELTYLLFLYFGQIMEGLSLYTLRDLGIKRMNNYRGRFKPRFTTLAEAETHFFYALLLEDLTKAPALQVWPHPTSAEVKRLKNKALILLAETCESEEDSLEFLRATDAHPAREKQARLLWKKGLSEECEALLQTIISSPWEEEEALFAEDFLQRKFGKKRISILTEELRDSRRIEIDESYFRHPEIGAIDFLGSEKWEAYHTENHFWNLLFGLLFWEEIFCHPDSVFRNSFELLPADLLNGNFYSNHTKAIDEKLSYLKEADLAWDYVSRIAEEKQDEQLGIFSWDESSLDLLRRALSAIPASALQMILRRMSEDYPNFSSGFPDLIAFQEEKVKFIEVKATGDSLKHGQLKMINCLRASGLAVEVLRVDYCLNPEQVYTVVDLETTGGRADWDRITEIGAVKVRGGVVVDRFQTLVNPGRSIPKFIQELTGITNDMVKTAPSFDEVAEAFREFSEGIFVAHNVNFDYKFLQKEFERIEERFVRPFICTKAQMKKFYPKLESYSLKELTTLFEIPLENHHRALSDAEAAAGLLNLINKKRFYSSKSL